MSNRSLTSARRINNFDKIVLNKPFTISSADGLKEGISIEAKEIWRALSVEYDKDVFVVGAKDSGVNTGRLTMSDLLHLRDDVLKGREYELAYSVSEEQSDARPYKISYGTFPGVNNIFGDIHVDFGDKLLAVGFREVLQMAEEYGGAERMQDKHVWADFTDEKRATDFANRMV